MTVNVSTRPIDHSLSHPASLQTLSVSSRHLILRRAVRQAGEDSLRHIPFERGLIPVKGDGRTGGKAGMRRMKQGRGRARDPSSAQGFAGTFALPHSIRNSSIQLVSRAGYCISIREQAQDCMGRNLPSPLRAVSIFPHSKYRGSRRQDADVEHQTEQEHP